MLKKETFLSKFIEIVRFLVQQQKLTVMTRHKLLKIREIAKIIS